MIEREVITSARRGGAIGTAQRPESTVENVCQHSDAMRLLFKSCCYPITLVTRNVCAQRLTHPSVGDGTALDTEKLNLSVVLVHIP